MKKALIAGAASAALAAMPVVGVFAAEGTVNTTTVDTMTLNIPSGCNLTTAQADRSDTVAAFGTVAPGQTATDGTTAFSISCNDSWKLTPSITKALAKDGGPTIASGATALDGTVSEWALKLGTPEGVTVTNAFSNFAAVNGTSTLSGQTAAAAAGLTVTPTYKVSIAPGQVTGDYSGEVTYTVALNS